MDTLLAKLAEWRRFRALVIGDFMLDQFHYGAADRLSADAPVPVLRVTRQEDSPGGAANLCLDLVALRGSVVALGVVGQDAEANLLRTTLNQQGVDAGALVTDPNRPTTVKRNLIGLAQGRHAQKMFRVDFESREPVAPGIAERLLRSFDDALKNVDVVCIEDYNKGVCTHEVCRAVIDRARAAGKPVFVDPAPATDYTKYTGATAITPNRTEAERATGMTIGDDAGPAHAARLARRVLDDLELETVVVTLDRQGALLLTRDDPNPISVPTVARDVYDVTGAGDMMLAALAAARCNHLDWESSVRFANAAAGLEVEVFGVVPIPLEKVHAELLTLSARQGGKHFTEDELMVQVNAARQAGRRVVFTNGCFDVLHAGHVTLLEKAAHFGDFLVVALNDDASVRALKGEGRPVNDQERRARVVGALNSVNAVVLFSEETPQRLIERVLPDVLVKGSDYAEGQVVGGEAVKRAGGRVELVDLVEGLSTTSTLERIRRN
ncbi:MAG: bifunctional protein HldE [Phycisphaeraceae bacterium]|nr:MAG: bifunctional protein HldE [Phycisphaeraceae bacterium]